MATKLSLRVHRVKCVDETGGRWAEKVGNDEIYLGGFAVTNQNGDTVKIDPVSIYSDFDDGDVKVFNPPMVFHTVTIPNSGDWPKTFAIGLILIEKDAGGMVGAVTKITDFFETELKKKLAQPAVAGAAPLIAGALLKYAIIAIAPTVISYVKQKIVSVFSDEIFMPNMATVDISSANFTWSGSTDSAQKTIEFRDHGGIYQVTYDWKLS